MKKGKPNIYIRALKAFSLLCLAFVSLSSCQKADNLILADGNEGVTVLGWSVTQSGNPQIRTVDSQEPRIAIELNRAHIYHDLQSDIGFGVGSARFHTSTIKSVSMEVNQQIYEFDAHNDSSFSYPNAQVQNPTNFIALPDDAPVAFVHLNGYSLEDSTLIIPSPVSILSPLNGATFNRQIDLNVKWQIQKSGGHIVVILRTLEDTGSSEKFIVKNLAADNSSVVFTAQEIALLPVGRAHLMVGSANIKRTNKGEVVLIGQSSGASIFNLN